VARPLIEEMLVYPHRIRLRGPWQCEPVGGPAPFRMTLPCRWAEGGLGDFTGRVRFRRRFGYPGQIDDYERVWLTFTGAESVVTVTLNGNSLFINSTGQPASSL